ncbi:Halomucin, partial [Stegodyphus mimosarum]
MQKKENENQLKKTVKNDDDAHNNSDLDDDDNDHKAHHSDVDEDYPTGIGADGATGIGADDGMDQDRDTDDDDYDDNREANEADDDDGTNESDADQDDVAAVDEDDVDDNDGQDDASHEANDGDDVGDEQSVQNNQVTAKNKLNQFEQGCFEQAKEKTPAKSAETPKTEIFPISQTTLDDEVTGTKTLYLEHLSTDITTEDIISTEDFNTAEGIKPFSSHILDVVMLKKDPKEQKEWRYNPTKLFLSDIPGNTAISQIAELFPNASQITLNLSHVHPNATITYIHENDALDAFKATMNAEILGRKITVLYSLAASRPKKRKKRAWKYNRRKFKRNSKKMKLLTQQCDGKAALRIQAQRNIPRLQQVKREYKKLSKPACKYKLGDQMPIQPGLNLRLELKLGLKLRPKLFGPYETTKVHPSDCYEIHPQARTPGKAGLPCGHSSLQLLPSSHIWQRQQQSDDSSSYVRK